ncbi:MAG: response regulator transcription factor [Anaerolineales bacterium]|nr:response regulator transcription factor [Anaerolineales bacterium]
MEPIRILLADDHRFFRDGVRALLETVPDFTVVAEAGNGEEVVEKATQYAPDVVLMDLQMPGLNGVEATRRILRVRPQTGIILVTMFEDTDSVLAAMRAGARGYILKDADEDVLLRSIRAVAKGEALFGPAVAKRLLDFIADVSPSAPKTAFPELTDREREVLALLAEGLTNQEIADRMGCSLKTARNHVSNILSKLHAADRNEAIARARAAGLGMGKL